MRSSGSWETRRSARDGPWRRSAAGNACSSSAPGRAGSRRPGTWRVGAIRSSSTKPAPAGGMMHFGIPEYRMPREVLDGEIERIAAIGVDDPRHTVTDLVAEKQEGGFDAVFLAVGAHLSKRQDIPARDAGKVYDALQFLKRRDRREAADRPARRGLRRRQHGDGRGSDGREAWGGRTAHHLPPHARADAGPCRGGRRGRSKKASRSTGCARSRRSTARR